ncbi:MULTISPECIES: Crp/Fnr family transcriptional regulator [unclassified Spirosoma]|uniref:Crp/Fnr family transcriptional regulator n=1 Tax=unclassified Spirosoma TaxID=2621999 RepID=UPI0009662594|nr:MULTISPECIES: Crp/Fnr family transcriptional regulator [unclassified Spirosoma]MBN8824210.1 Crp/Fnr family transcriptional regulator [Spirosoma sp.]OJW78944.1 MAG: Crp/Fnr family transcriptional regulator [Spirosoma sp. 48-14]
MNISLNYLQETFKGQFEYALLDELAKVGQQKIVPAGEYLIRPGEYIRSVPIIIRGSVKIMRPDQEGREALLYYLGGLDACAMSLTCCLGSRRSEITAVAEEETELIAIPVDKVDEWLCRYSTWKQFVFQTYQKRFDNLLTTIDEVTFHKLDERLLTYLQKKMQSCQCRELTITHEEIANELATSREVISRLLKQLEKMNKLKLQRGKIEMVGA